ncbi:MAG TPA: vanadium-dependent haloperoxidase [Candidatus Limnocylindrales bacterium]|nr:vanadium-dependent haloperoxidase [Candidatus Limnocylindrales bacterium]
MRARSILLSCLLVASALLPATANAAAPNVVVTWNQYAVDALSNLPTAPLPGAGQPPPVASLHLAMVHGAVYDAVNSIDGGHEPLLIGLPAAPSDASLAAAAITAAHHVLVGLVPALPGVVLDRLNAQYLTDLGAIAVGDAKDDGVDAGAAAATAMLANRANDGRFGPFRFTPGDEAGEWVPAPPAGLSDPNAWVARVRPFTLERTSQFRTEGPPPLNSPEYTADFNEVKSIGSATNSTRDDKQNALASFYAENPVTLFHRTFRTIATEHGLSIAASARLFGMLSVSVADSIIGCWDNKAFWSNWRPITAIRLGDDDSNPATVGQADWTPLLPTPPYPDIASGYNCFSGAMFHAAGKFFGTDRFTFVMRSNTSNTDRTYTRFTHVVRDTIDVRVYQGLHFRFADIQGAWLGKKVAQWIDRHAFQPID